MVGLPGEAEMGNRGKYAFGRKHLPLGSMALTREPQLREEGRVEPHRLGYVRYPKIDVIEGIDRHLSPPHPGLMRYGTYHACCHARSVALGLYRSRNADAKSGNRNSKPS